MARTVTEIEADTQALEPVNNERSLEVLLDDAGPADPEVDRAWLEEVQRRSRELDESAVAVVSWEQVAADVRARLRRQDERAKDTDVYAIPSEYTRDVIRQDMQDRAVALNILEGLADLRHDKFSEKSILNFKDKN